jgi:predicted benzoate:H+ symporter BenE
VAKKQDKAWQYTFSTALAAVTLLLVFGYFAQSFIEIRKVKPVSVAIERIKGGSVEAPVNTGISTEVKKDEENVENQNN